MRITRIETVRLIVVASDQPGESPIDRWGPTAARGEAMPAEADRLRRERGPQEGADPSAGPAGRRARGR